MKIPTLNEIDNLLSQIDKLEDEKSEFEDKINKLKAVVFPPGYIIKYNQRYDGYDIEINGQIENCDFITYALAVQGAWKVYFTNLKSEKLRLQNEINIIDTLLITNKNNELWERKSP